MRRLLNVLGAIVLACASVPTWAEESVAPINLVVNSDKDEDEPHSSVRNGIGHLYFSRGGDLFAAQRSGQTWLKPKPFEELNQHRGEYRSVYVSFQRSTSSFPQYLVYATNRDVNKADGRGDNFDLYMKLRDNAGGVDVNVAIPLHFCTADDEMHPWLTTAGTMYFSRKTRDGWRIFAATAAKEKMSFNKPTLVELPPGFHHATLTPDGRFMYVQGPLTGDRWGLFRSQIEDGKWSKPEELTAINDPKAPRGDMSPCLSRDGSMLYFVSDRQGGKGGLDIWAIPTDKLKN